jgi:quinol monooxygenase YgiN
MNSLRPLILAVALFCTLVGAEAMSEETARRYVQIAEIDIDPAQLSAYKAALAEHTEAALRLEPGVLMLYSVARQDNPAHITVFEVYRDREAYLSHLQAAHFLKYKSTVEKMVTSLKLIAVDPLSLDSKAK